MSMIKLNYANDKTIMDAAIAKLNSISLGHIKETGNRVSKDLEISRAAYIYILAYVTCRLDLAKKIRDAMLPLYKYIDREYYSYLKRDADDEKRERDNYNARGIKPVDEKLSMIFAQIDEAATYLLTVLAPDDALYTAMAPVDQQDEAKGLAKLMNMHDEEFGHYRNYAMFINSALRYNLGLIGVEWTDRIGTTSPTTPGDRVNQGPSAKSRMLTSGNELIAFDVYNSLLDPSCNPVDLPVKGEFFGHVEMETPFRLKLREQAGELYNVESFLATNSGVNATSSVHYFQPHEQVRDENMPNSGSNVDWFSLLSGMGNDVMSDELSLRETIRVYIWASPKRLKIDEKDDELKVYKITLGGKSHILKLEQMKNSHGMLPVNAAMPVEDHFAYQTKGIAERLIPYQRFASFTLNTHQRATRKKLYGLTLYDQNAIPVLNQANVDMTGGKIPVNMGTQSRKIQDMIHQFTDGPDTTNTLENITAMDQIMQKILPTNINQQVAGLERATQYQAASLVQGANRRNLKIAKTINSQTMNRCRRMQVQNVFEFQNVIETLDAEGKLVTINPATLRNTTIEFTISDGLKGLDRLALQINMKELFNTILQSQQAVAQTDVMALANYISTLFGDNTDFNQFKLKSPIDALPAEQRTLAFQLLQELIAKQQAQGAEGQPSATPIPGVPGAPVISGV